MVLCSMQPALAQAASPHRHWLQLPPLVVWVSGTAGMLCWQRWQTTCQLQALTGAMLLLSRLQKAVVALHATDHWWAHEARVTVVKHAPGPVTARRRACAILHVEHVQSFTWPSP
jgi:hypothetical protein